MKTFRQGFGFAAAGKKLGLSFIVALLLATGGAYIFSGLIDEMNSAAQQQTGQILVAADSIDEAAIALGHQTQEWKDMLLRFNDRDLFAKHQLAFITASVEVQRALLRTQTTMHGIGMDTGEVELLRVEHQSLLSYYQLAQTLLNPQQELSFREVDRQVFGVDRNLQHHIATVRTEIDRQSQQRLSAGLSLMQNNRKQLSVTLGALLMFMAMIGFVLADPRNLISLLRVTAAPTNRKTEP